MNRCWGLAKINGGNYQHYLFAPPPSVTSWGPGPVIIIIATWADVKVKLSPQSKSSSHITLCTICDLWFCCIQCVYFRCSEQPFAWVSILTRNHVLAAKTTSIFSYFIKTSCQENWFFFFFLWGGEAICFASGSSNFCSLIVFAGEHTKTLFWEKNRWHKLSKNQQGYWQYWSASKSSCLWRLE